MTYSFIQEIIEDHAGHLRQVLQKLREWQLYAKASKCQIQTETIEFLGQQITANGMTPTDEKLRAVREWETPKDVKDVRSFLGFANYYRRFVQSFAAVAHPLTELTRKDVAWQWGPMEEKAFRSLQQRLCEAPILQYPDPTLPYTVVTDASGTAVGGVLMQDKGDGLRPLAFMSRALKPAEQRYSAYERELAAVAYCFIQWRHYLEGCPGGVTVVTDHQPLTLLMSQQVLSRVQTRWIRLGFFQSIRPVIKYQPGKANIVADALSRSRGSRESSSDERVLPDTEELNVMTRSMLVPTDEVQLWHKAQREDPVL